MGFPQCLKCEGELIQVEHWREKKKTPWGCEAYMFDITQAIARTHKHTHVHTRPHQRINAQKSISIKNIFSFICSFINSSFIYLYSWQPCTDSWPFRIKMYICTVIKTRFEYVLSFQIFIFSFSASSNSPAPPERIRTRFPSSDKP